MQEIFSTKTYFLITFSLNFKTYYYVIFCFYPYPVLLEKLGNLSNLFFMKQIPNFCRDILKLWLSGYPFGKIRHHYFLVVRHSFMIYTNGPISTKESALVGFFLMCNKNDWWLKYIQ